MTDSEKSLTLKLDRARWYLMSRNETVFYGQLAMGLSDVIGNPHGKTACTDGKRIFWDADFLGKLTDAETRFVVMHETLHPAHGHLWRFPKGSADHNRANQACDHAINLLLQSAKLDITMPAGGLSDAQYVGMAEEEIYARLQSQPKPQGGKNGKPQPGSGSGNGQPKDDPCGDYCEPAANENPAVGKDGKPKAQDSLQAQWERRVIQCAQAAKAMRGELPGDLARELDRVQAQPIDWRRETADFVRQSASARNDWTRSPRRHAWQSVIYPSRRSDAIGCIIGIRDTSGSIDDKLCAEFTALIASACAELNCELILMDVDTQIAREVRLAPGDELPLDAQGGGGTDFACVQNRIRELSDAGERIAGVIVLTDLCGSQFDPGELASLWLCTTDTQSTHGRTLRIL